MFGIFKSIKIGRVAAEVTNLLARNYSLGADKDRLIQHITPFIDITDNPDDLAIMYAANQIELMDRGNSRHIQLATKFIRVAKQAHVVGFARNEMFMQELAGNAKKYLGLDAGKIDAAPC